MRHLDLFSGIGGFALAAETVWSDITHTFVEYDPFCQAVLRKHWPQATQFKEIRDFVANTKREVVRGKSTNMAQAQQQECEEPKIPWECWLPSLGGSTGILTGGFPCQPFSQAGRRKGTADDRYLWPPMLECISLFRPRWVIAENVAGLVTWSDGLVLETVCTDLEKEGYEVQPFVIPAVAVGAPHRRDRVWIVAHADNERRDNGLNNREGRHLQTNEGTPEEDKQERQGRERGFGQIGTDDTWRQSWIEAATSLCRVDDGLPRRMDRTPRLKALGNAIVPQVAAQIFQAIKEVESTQN